MKRVTLRQAAELAAGFGLLAALSTAGDLATNRFRLSIPGPIIGMGTYLLLLWIAPRAVAWTLPAARTLTQLLGAMIVPAAVGLAAFAPLITGAPLRLAAVLVASTIVTGIATAMIHSALSRRQT